jgi:cytochrome c5
VAALTIASSLAGQAAKPNATVTAVEGESWSSHIHRTFNETSMGKTGDLGPAPPVPGDSSSNWRLELSPAFAAPTVTLHGADLYRLNCRGCHGELGHGAPPEINSVIGPVQATSVASTTQKMKDAGREISRSDIAEGAKESKGLLLQRLHLGGQRMPPPTLSEDEIRSLVPYLQQLSDVPGAEKSQVAVKVSFYRVGEHIVKSTCHVCHNATGPNPTPEQILQGTIPPLSALTTRVSLTDFVRKVTAGAPISMGRPPAFYRGRMPVFRYLTQDEAAEAYLYLNRYPPK